MDKLLSILNEVNSDIDYENCTTLIDDKLLDSFAILSIVSEIEDEFEVNLGPADIIPENFNSVKAMREMIERMGKE